MPELPPLPELPSTPVLPPQPDAAETGQARSEPSVPAEPGPVEPAPTEPPPLAGVPTTPELPSTPVSAPDESGETAIVKTEKINEGIVGTTEQIKPWAFIIGGISAFFMLVAGFFLGKKKSKKKSP
jgi:hypothetical protein